MDGLDFPFNISDIDLKWEEFLKGKTISTCGNHSAGDLVPNTLVPSDYLQYVPIPTPPTIPDWEIALKIISTVLWVILDISGNSMVILIVLRNRTMRRNVINHYIVNLAVSDIMVGLICSWPLLGNGITQEYPFSGFVCKVNTFMGSKYGGHSMVYRIIHFIWCSQH